MKKSLLIQKRGYTLVELTVMILVGLIIATMTLTLLNNQIASFGIIKTQNFLVADAPQINNTLNRIVSRANSFRLYPTFTDVTNATNPTINNAQTLVLLFQSSGQAGALNAAPTFGVIGFNAATNSLDYYSTNDLTTLNQNTSPSWNISKQVNNVNYNVINGVLRLTITGPNGGTITYSTTTQR